MLVTFGGEDPQTGELYATLILEAQGWGGKIAGDGWDAVAVPNANCPVTPVEVYESALSAAPPSSYGAQPGLGRRRSLPRRARDCATARAPRTR